MIKRVVLVALVLLAIAAVLSFAGCGSDGETASSADSGALEGSVEAAVDVAAPPPYPAFPLDLPTVADYGGHKLTNPKVVALMDPTDPRAAAVTAVLQNVGASDYWRTVTQEYGIGPLGSVSVNPFPAPLPASMTTKDLEALVAGYAYASYGGDAGPSDAATGPSTPDGFRTDTLYVVVVPFTTTITDLTCAAAFGYHTDVPTTLFDSVPYAVVMPCKGGGITPTEVVTHELVEAVTDPFYTTIPSLKYVDDAHLAWVYAGQTEVADMCDVAVPAIIGGASVPAAAIWSNASASKGKYPCLPLAPDASTNVFEAKAVFTSTLRYDARYKTPGVLVALNDTVVVDVTVSSLQPTGPLQLQVFDVGKVLFKSPAELTLSLDRTTATNGDVVHLTIARDRNPPTGITVFGSVFGLTATDPTTKNSWTTFGFVASKQ